MSKSKLTPEDHALLNNSIERVINTTYNILDDVLTEEATINQDDWRALKPLVCRLFDEARNRAFCRANNLPVPPASI